MAREIRGEEPPDISKPWTRQRDMSPSTQGILLAIAGACLFSTKPIIIKFTYAYPIDPVTLMTLRMAFSLPFYLLFAVLAFRERKASQTPTDLSRTTLLQTALVGVLGYYIASYLDLEGLTRITAQFERLILFTYPTFVILLGALFFKHKITVRMLLALGVTYAGLAVIFGQDLQLFGDGVITGAAFVLGAAVTFAGYILFSQFGIKKLGARLFTFFAMIAASIAILCHFALTHSLQILIQPVQVYGLTFMIALISTVAPSFMIAAAIEKIGPGPTSLLSGVGPVFTTVLGIVLLSETFTPWHFVGIILVLGGALILSYKRRKI